MALDFLLDKAKENTDKAISYEDRDDLKKAKDHYFKASEYLFKAAKESKGEMKEIRIKNAEKLLNKANSLKSKIETEIPVKAEQMADIKEGIQFVKCNDTFDDIVDLDETKSLLKRLAIPIKDPEVFKKHPTLRPSKGVILHGPPGCGKTLLVRALANEIEANLLLISMPEVLSKWFGESPKNIFRIFKEARENAPCIVVFDEIDALTPERGLDTSEAGKRVVTTFLSEIDGFLSKDADPTKPVYVIGTTNKYELLDKGILDRLSTHIEVPHPNKSVRKVLLERQLRPEKTKDLDFKRLSELTQGFSSREIVSICNEAIWSIISQDKDEITMETIEGEILRRKKGEKKVPSIVEEEKKTLIPIHDERIPPKKEEKTLLERNIDENLKPTFDLRKLRKGD